MEFHHIYGSIYSLQMSPVTSCKKAPLYTGLQGGRPEEGTVEIKQLCIIVSLLVPLHDKNGSFITVFYWDETFWCVVLLLAAGRGFCSGFCSGFYCFHPFLLDLFGLVFDTLAYFGAYHFQMSGPAWWCQHPVWHWIHSELWCSPSEAALSSFAVCCLLPSSVCIHIFCFFTASGLPSSLSARLAVLTMSCGLQGDWDGLNVKLGGEEGRPRLTQVTLELEALTACIHERLLHLFSFVAGRFSPSLSFWCAHCWFLN